MIPTRVACVVGARPNFMKIAPLVREGRVSIAMMLGPTTLLLFNGSVDRLVMGPLGMIFLGVMLSLIMYLYRTSRPELLPVVPASEFADLAVGGPNNDYRVEAYVIGAERFQNGKTWLKATFDQNLGELKVQAPAKLRAKALARVRREAP